MIEYLPRLKNWFLALSRDQKIAIIAGVVVPIGLVLWQSSQVTESNIDNSSTEEVETQNNKNNSITDSNVSINEKTIVLGSENTTIVGDQSLNPTLSNNTINITLGNSKNDETSIPENLVYKNSYENLDISGIVTDENNKVISNAIVEITSYKISSEPSDMNGKFTIVRASPTDSKDAQIIVTAEGYRDKYATIDLNNQYLNITLQKRKP